MEAVLLSFLFGAGPSPLPSVTRVGPASLFPLVCLSLQSPSLSSCLIPGIPPRSSNDSATGDK
ncbi:hypothetical protein DPEC_G00216910 [Dallia pectoralis]|uniref:Uncharacterized protein n=1 Tax=Dallia pectoralis TaxID=75939 RepID=A0ACC2G332_DALPE|nr:hypothetical protein DPEC_G00216910 [Dallia pectoralis]